jgi:hypothetical protein
MSLDFTHGHRCLLREFKTAGRKETFDTQEISNAFAASGASLKVVGRSPLRSDSVLSKERLEVVWEGKVAAIYFDDLEKKRVRGAQGLVMFNILNAILNRAPN